MPKPFAKVRLHRSVKRARSGARFGVAVPGDLPGGYQLVLVEEVEPVLDRVTDQSKFGLVILAYERRAASGKERLTITQGYTSPAQPAGAPEGSSGTVRVGDRTATWIAGQWEVANPGALPPSEEPSAHWVAGGMRLAWKNDDLTSTTIEATDLSLEALIEIAAGLVGGGQTVSTLN